MTPSLLFFGSELKNQPVLSSGTWEILMVRAEGFKQEKNSFDLGITTELDAEPGFM
jgi:L-fuculokinase